MINHESSLTLVVITVVRNVYDDFLGRLRQRRLRRRFGGLICGIVDRLGCMQSNVVLAQQQVARYAHRMTGE